MNKDPHTEGVGAWALLLLLMFFGSVGLALFAFALGSILQLITGV